MSLRDSVWYPTTGRRAAVVAAVVGMTILHQSELFGLMDAGLLFGWLPIQFAYDIGLALLSVVLLYGIYRLTPDPPDRFEAAADADEPATTDAPDAQSSA